MMKKFRSVEIDTNSMQIFRNGKEIELPYDIHFAFIAMNMLEYLKDTYSNDEETLWDVAVECTSYMFECEANNEPVPEYAAIDYASEKLEVELIEV